MPCFLRDSRATTPQAHRIARHKISVPGLPEDPVKPTFGGGHQPAVRAQDAGDPLLLRASSTAPGTPARSSPPDRISTGLVETQSAHYGSLIRTPVWGAILHHGNRPDRRRRGPGRAEHVSPGPGNPPRNPGPGHRYLSPHVGHPPCTSTTAATTRSPRRYGAMLPFRRTRRRICPAESRMNWNINFDRQDARMADREGRRARDRCRSGLRAGAHCRLSGFSVGHWRWN